MTGIGGNERGILNHPATDRETSGIELPLEVGPELVNHTAVDETILEDPDR